MRKELKYIIWAHIILILYLAYLSFDLITLLYDDSFSDALLEVELNPVNDIIDKPQLIPKIIHQTYKTNDIPEIWKAGQQACIDLHKQDYQYMLWTDDTARKFIQEHYPWFLKTWDSYPYPIQRADAIRYFVLDHHGGIYIDLDDGCQRKLDALLTVPAFVRKTLPTGISNDVMGAVPSHPFFKKVIEDLQKYQRNWLVPYITIMFSTGPLFLSVMWKQYKRWGVPEAGKVRILMPEDYKGNKYSFFSIAPGSSWHMHDAKFVKGLANHLVLAVIGGFLIAAVVFLIEYLFYLWVTSSSFKKLLNKITNIFVQFTRLIKLDQAYNFIMSYFSSSSSSKSYTQLPGDEESQQQPPKKKNKILNLLNYNKSVKRRSRKDSNLPIEFNILEKIADDDTTIVDNSTIPSPIGTTAPVANPSPEQIIINDANNGRNSSVDTLVSVNGSGSSSGDDEAEIYVMRKNDHIV
ncbi:CSH1 [[Candida] subhashii]|uniref:inositol phosphorylceramide mannosyltransferase n=1 Tax=[Candida] subhashii TaxID=561895 RepID=A0A8J5QHR0_9ASCO|nr:CSH1 [[Candida] subhashii]KAG7661103.1 CSH1 [[Candida] subhashii]